MSTYYIDISGQFNVDKMTQALRDEEILFTEFKDSRVMTADDLTVVNHTKFEEVDTRPTKQVTLILNGTAAPSGTTKFWTGTMVIAGTISTVEAYR
jgi:hypothetical protein